MTTNIPGVDADEFPYASTYEGGAGAGAWPMPSWENQGEGRELGLFYKASGLLPGQQFNISLGGGTPSPVREPVVDPVPKPVLVPVNLPDPYGKPIPILVPPSWAPRITPPRVIPVPVGSPIFVPLIGIPEILPLIVPGGGMNIQPEMS